MENKDKRILIMVIVLVIMFAVIGSTFAYFSWVSSEAQQTNVTFTAETDFSCSVDGGGNITSSDVMLAPSTCTNSEYAIKRTVNVTPKIDNSGKTIYMDLWLDVNSLGEGLSDSVNFRYALTTSDSSCDSDIVASGTFNGETSGGKVFLLNSKEYISTSNNYTTTNTYYLYIWLDAEETSSSTMDQEFDLSLGGSCTDSSKASAPVIDTTGMIPVSISNNGVVSTVSEDNNAWYNYNQKEWANAVLVSEGSRSNYLNTNNVIVDQDDILAYYVWIPRYKYAISELKCPDVENVNETDNPECYKFILSDDDKTSLINYWYNEKASLDGYTIEDATADIEEGLNNAGGYFYVEEEAGRTYSIVDIIGWYNWDNDPDMIYTTQLLPNASYLGAREINIVFEDSTSTKSLGNAVGTDYRTHPAFTFGDDEIEGIWVGKFDTTEGTTENVGISNPTILPSKNNNAFLNLNVITHFQTALKFSGGTLSNGTVSFAGSSTYGLASTTDSHMMKSRDWGAVAYLSHSEYGINGQIRINNYYNNGILTGCGSLTENAGTATTCGILYGGATEYPQSTTGNISGIFDMSGGADDTVMGVFANSSGSLWTGNSASENSGFTGLYGTSGTSYTGIKFPPSKYFDTYKATSGTTISVTTACDGGVCYGHALSETLEWYGDYAYFVTSTYPWVMRGTNSLGPYISPGVFTFNRRHGGLGTVGYGSASGFRSILVVN